MKSRFILSLFFVKCVSTVSHEQLSSEPASEKVPLPQINTLYRSFKFKPSAYHVSFTFWILLSAFHPHLFTQKHRLIYFIYQCWCACYLKCNKCSLPFVRNVDDRWTY